MHLCWKQEHEDYTMGLVSRYEYNKRKMCSQIKWSLLGLTYITIYEANEKERTWEKIMYAFYKSIFIDLEKIYCYQQKPKFEKVKRQ